MSSEEYSRIAQVMWAANKGRAKEIAESLFVKHSLPPAAPILVGNLAALLADLQMQSFMHGVMVVLYTAAKTETVQ